MPSLQELTGKLAQGTRSQKGRCWQALVLDAGLWQACQSTLHEPEAADSLRNAYRDLTGRWDRAPLHGGVPSAAAQVEAQLATVQRTVAAAALTAHARGAYDPDALVLWAARAVGQPPSSRSPLFDRLPPGSARCRVRTTFRALHAELVQRGAEAAALRELAAAQDAALSFLAGLPGEEPIPTGEQLKLPLLLARGAEGFLAWLWLESRPSEFGQVFQAPDARLTPLLPDLLEAVEAACTVARPDLPSDDVRWWISDLPVCPDGQRFPVGGASVGAAAAVGLSHLLRRQKIKARCAITATLTSDGRLGPVEGLRGMAPKLEAARRLATGGETVTVIVGPESRLPETEVAEWREHHVHVVTADTLGDAERLSLDADPAPDDGGGDERSLQTLTLLYVRDSPVDRRRSESLRRDLETHGYTVDVDPGAGSGVAWAQEAERRIRSAECVLILLTRDAEHSETWNYEVQLAHEAYQSAGRPRLILLPVGEIAPPQLLASSGYPRVPLPADEETPSTEATRCPPALLAHLRGSSPRPLPNPDLLVAPTGVLPLKSAFYLERAADREFRAALIRGESIIRIKGARQMGKTSLLARGLQQARDTGATVIVTDFQLLNQSHLESVDIFLQTLARHIARQAQVKLDVAAMWDSLLGASVNFREFLLELLPQVPGPIVWGLDEVDRLFACDFRAEVFGLLRSLHNERALNPALPWSRLSLILCYATEAQLFLSDVNQSPFNVGARLPLDDFSREELAELNRRYDVPLRSSAERAIYYDLLAGHPYLTHRGLHALATQRVTLSELQRQAVREDGLFGDHLRRLLLLMVRNPELVHAVGEIVRGRPCPSAESFFRLWSAGVVVGESAREARPRCRLYADYLGRHLP